MISGALFLKKDIYFKNIFCKYVKRLIITFYLWSLIYSIFSNLSNRNKKHFILKFLSGHYHLWYLLTSSGLYIITPFLREIIKNEKLLTVFIILFVIFSFIIPNFILFIYYYSYELYISINNINYCLDLNSPRGYVFYYVIGYYLNYKYNISRRKTIIIYLFGILGMFFTTVISHKITIMMQKKMNFFTQKNINVLIFTISIFIFFKQNFNISNLNKKNLIRNISNHTFGIYLIHPLIIEFLFLKVFSFSKNLNLIYHIPLMSLIIYIISLLIAIIIKKLPFIGNFLF